MTADILRARKWARFYRDAGYNPLPSVPGVKVPSLSRYAHLRDHGIPPGILARWWRPSIQVCTGARWDLVVVDLDGPLAADEWRRLAHRHGCPPTWVVRTRRGFHLWFSSSASFPHKTVIWQVPGVDHAGIEVLADRNLVLAPPSAYCDGSGRYTFLAGRSPHALDRPADLPAWVADLVAAHVRRPALIPFVPPPSSGTGRCATHYDRSDVLFAIPDKLRVAGSWGLRIVNAAPNAAGWCVCRAALRADRTPSAMFSPATGRYWEPEMGRLPMSLFDLGVLIGGYPDWMSCCDDLGRQYCAGEARRAG
jgi:hypothetical protein